MQTAIILSGSGMRGSHGGGFLYELNKLDLKPHIILGTSGDAGNALYFSSGQYENMSMIWKELVTDPSFITFWRFWKLIDVDYLIDALFRKRVPIDTKALSESAIRWIIPLTHAVNGTTRYVTALDKLDPYEILRAAKAVPLFYGKSVMIQGEPYIDGEVGATLQDLCERVIQAGAERILIIEHGSGHKHGMSFFEWMYSFILPPGLRKAFVRDYTTPSVCPLGTGTARVWCPSFAELPASFSCNDGTKLCETFERGRADAHKAEQELRAFFTR